MQEHTPHRYPAGLRPTQGESPGYLRRGEDSNLGSRLRKRRRELGWTQTELAERVGTSQAVVQKIENGKSLRPRILEQLARAMDVKPAWLMFGVEEAGELNDEAIELARAWARLREPHRTAMREAILRIGGLD
jgi:transcriptional regulator with XRE-family HTH domain